jgi:hypothetical protein
VQIVTRGGVDTVNGIAVICPFAVPYLTSSSSQKQVMWDGTFLKDLMNSKLQAVVQVTADRKLLPLAAFLSWDGETGANIRFFLRLLRDAGINFDDFFVSADGAPALEEALHAIWPHATRLQDVWHLGQNLGKARKLYTNWIGAKVKDERAAARAKFARQFPEAFAKVGTAVDQVFQLLDEGRIEAKASSAVEVLWAMLVSSRSDNATDVLLASMETAVKQVRKQLDRLRGATPGQVVPAIAKQIVAARKKLAGFVTARRNRTANSLLFTCKAPMTGESYDIDLTDPKAARCTCGSLSLCPHVVSAMDLAGRSFLELYPPAYDAKALETVLSGVALTMPLGRPTSSTAVAVPAQPGPKPGRRRIVRHKHPSERVGMHCSACNGNHTKRSRSCPLRCAPVRQAAG